MDVVEQINAVLSRATQDFDGRDEIMQRAANRIAALEAENERLRKALEPFAEVAGRFDGLAVSAILPQQCWFTPHSLREARAARATTGDKSAPPEPSKEQIERAIEAYREGVYLTDEQVHASVTAIVRAALEAKPEPRPMHELLAGDPSWIGTDSEAKP